MSVSPMALKAYTEAMQTGQNIAGGKLKGSNRVHNDFADTLQSSLKEVNNLQVNKNAMIESFASGKSQNVHELMISMEKAGVAMRMTSAVRNKVLESYRELMQMPF
ncbi:flagellar hook-basal body complex protein FliE [Desulfonatronospira sp.]|uniref:flagellar hook-basal body complex protein FliE n=1 Tax=Desulfonatronospira sp. TaxID=1962951 RepID=UPI0025C0270D|nr:flagellar hook-basal body complex protein FliE [Desulfonatronospira sp.]